MTPTVPTLEEITSAFEKALAEARRRVEAASSGLGEGFTIPETVYASIAAKAVAMFSEEFKTGLVDAVTRLIKEGKGPTRRNRSSLA